MATTATISQKVHDCFTAFRSLFQTLKTVVDPETGSQPTITAWHDESGRFRIWASNIGAHQKGQSSLDYRLRDASHIRDQINRLLQDLKDILDEAVAALGSDDDGHGNGLDTNLPDEFAEMGSELEQIHAEIVNVINGLYRMSMLIRKPAPHDWLTKLRASDAAASAHFDQAHVADKFPQADCALVERLGKAITQRRMSLEYRKRHHDKLSRGVSDHLSDGQEPQQTNDYLSSDGQALQRTNDYLSETIATDLPAMSIDEAENATQLSDVSETSYAASLMDGGSITVPSAPKESSEQQPFECPFCFFIITIKNRRAWMKHIFRDLLAYNCLFENCSNPNKMYESRHEWFAHEMTSHLLPAAHIEMATGEVLPKASDLPNIPCPLCRNQPISGLQIEKHLARHLEVLALFALPKASWSNDGGSDEEHDEEYVRYEYYFFTKAGDWTVAKSIKLGAPQEELERAVAEQRKTSSVPDLLMKMSPEHRAQIEQLLDQKNLEKMSKDGEWYCVFIDTLSSNVKEIDSKSILEHKKMDIIIAQHISPSRTNLFFREKTEYFKSKRLNIEYKDIYDYYDDPFDSVPLFSNTGVPLDKHGPIFEWSYPP